MGTAAVELPNVSTPSSFKNITWVIKRPPDHPINRIDELMPRNWQAEKPETAPTPDGYAMASSLFCYRNNLIEISIDPDNPK
jgi:hypothetical protein